MADRYWVGGSGTWNTTSTTNWSATSGGTGGASVPTVSDNVFFDQSGTYTVTMTGALACLDITVSAGIVTFATGASPTLNVRGSMALISGTVWGSTGAVTFSSITSGRTITTDGTTINGAITFNGSGGVWTLGSALTTSGALSISSGTLNTSASGNYSLYASSLTVASTSAAGLSLNASTVAVFGTGTAINVGSSSTFSSGTSTINLTSNGAVSFSANGKTFYDVNFTGIKTSTSNTTINGSHTFNNLSFASPATNTIYYVVFAGNQVINTLSGSGSSQTARIVYRSSTLGTARLLSLTNSSTISNADFRDIQLFIPGGTIDASSGGGDCGGNSGITFPAAKNVYWNLAGTQNWTNNGWASTDGGTPSPANFPLAQDTVWFTNNGAAGTVTISNSWNVGGFVMSNRTFSMTLFFASGVYLGVYGSWHNGSGVTLSGSAATINFAKRGGVQSVSGNGQPFAQAIVITAISSSFQLNSGVTTTNTVTLTNGVLSVGSYTLTCTSFSSATTTVRSISFGGGNITVTSSGTPWDTSTITNFSINGTSSINVSYAGASAVTISPGALNESSALNFNFTAGTYTLTLTASSTWGDLNFTGNGSILTNNAQTIYGSLTLWPAMSLASVGAAWVFAATSGVKTITTNGEVIPFPITFSGGGGTWQLQDAMTLGNTRTVTLTRGTLDLNGKTLTTGIFSSNNSNTRAIAFGTGNITLNGAGGTLCNMATTTGLTTTGTQVINVSYSGSSATTISVGSMTEADSISFNFTTGTYGLTFSSAFRDLNFTGYAGPIANNATRTVYGNLTVSTEMSFGVGASGTSTMTFAATSGVKTITTNGKVIPFPITFNGTGGTWQLQDALTLPTIAGRGVTLTAGTLNTNGYAVTADFLSTSLTTLSRTLTLGTSTVTLTGTGTPLNLFPSTSWPSLTVSAASSTINFTSASAKEAIVADKTWGTINQGGTGTLTFTGTLCTIGNLTNTVQPATVLFQSGNTFNFLDFNLSGTSGNQITIGSTTAGTQHTLSKSSGTVDVSYCSIADSNATGGATWNSLTSEGNVDNGNNSGWLFSGVVPVSGNFFAFFNGP